MKKGMVFMDLMMQKQQSSQSFMLKQSVVSPYFPTTNKSDFNSPKFAQSTRPDSPDIESNVDHLMLLNQPSSLLSPTRSTRGTQKSQKAETKDEKQQQPRVQSQGKMYTKCSIKENIVKGVKSKESRLGGKFTNSVL